MKYRIFIAAGIALVILLLIAALLFGRKNSGGLSGQLVVWSFESEAAWSPLIDAFREAHPDVRIVYEQKNPASYETDLLNTLAAGRGPDLFAVHHTWIDKHIDKLAPFPADIMAPQTLRATFVDVTARDLVRGEAVYALPLWVDTLALYYNRDIFNSAGIIAPPRTWEAFIETVEKTVRRNEARDILLAGATIGSSANIPHAGDILAAIMLQSGAEMVDERNEANFDQSVNVGNESINPGEEALGFFTDFADPANTVYTWNRRLPDALEMFTNGQAAMYLGYARDLPAVESSDIAFGVAQFPQIVDKQTDPSYIDLSYADYWAIGVSRTARSVTAAQTFASFVSSRNALFSFLNAARVPTARRDLIEVQARDELLEPFVRQTLTATSWRQPDFQETRRIFNSMIEDINLGRANANDALSRGVQEINGLLQPE